MALMLPRIYLKALQFQRPSWRRRLIDLESRQLVADDDTSEIWPSTGQVVHSRTKHEVTYNKIHVRVHHNENNVLVIVLYQREPYR